MSYLQKILQGIDEFRSEVHDGELDSGEIASWLYYQRKLEPSITDQVKLLQRDVSRAMSTQVFIDEQGRRVRKKLCLRRKVERTGGGSYIQATWFDKDIAPPSFKEAVFDQRRESAANMLWQLKQDIDHYNEYDNPSEKYQTTFDFYGDMADREAGRKLIMETQTGEEDYEDEELDDFDSHLFNAPK